MEKKLGSREIVELEAVGDVELKPSAWFEKTTTGVKYGCKSRQNSLKQAVDDVLIEMKRLKSEVESLFPPKNSGF